MPEQSAALELSDLYRLNEQIATDREASIADLRLRDHAIGQACSARDDVARLQYWLQQLTPTVSPEKRKWLNENGAATLLRVASLILGFVTMLGFLLASDRALVNVFYFLMIFVLSQLALVLLSAVVMWQAVRGTPPAVFPLNPTRLVADRALPDARYMRESAGVVRLLLLRYGQEVGAVFTFGAMLAFIALLAFTDFSFVWGSTFGLGNKAVESLTGALSLPWSGFFPAANLSPEVIADTRYNPSQLDLQGMSDDSRRGWWPFLLMCMAVYGLFPRVMLWAVSRFAYRRELNRAFLSQPGARAVLSRMRAPAVITQAEGSEEISDSPVVEIDETVMLLNWAGALDEGAYAHLDGFLRVPSDKLLAAGLGSPDVDFASISMVNSYHPETLLVAVKSWEPPMADLADILARVEGVPRCVLCLIPLPGKAVTEHSLEEWQGFSRALAFDLVEVDPLDWRDTDNA